MSDLVLDASLALQWFLEDEAGRQYSLSILASLSTKRAAIPILLGLAPTCLCPIWNRLEPLTSRRPENRDKPVTLFG